MLPAEAIILSIQQPARLRDEGRSAKALPQTTLGDLHRARLDTEGMIPATSYAVPLTDSSREPRPEPSVAAFGDGSFLRENERPCVAVETRTYRMSGLVVIFGQR